MVLSFWVCAGITLVSSLVSLGYAISGLRAATGEAVTPSCYALARSGALAAASAIALFTDSTAFVAAIAIAMVIVEAVDAVVGVRIKDRLKTFGPAVTAAASLAALIWMLTA